MLKFWGIKPHTQDFQKIPLKFLSLYPKRSYKKIVHPQPSWTLCIKSINGSFQQYRNSRDFKHNRGWLTNKIAERPTSFCINRVWKTWNFYTAGRNHLLILWGSGCFSFFLRQISTYWCSLAVLQCSIGAPYLDLKMVNWYPNDDYRLYSSMFCLKNLLIYTENKFLAVLGCFGPFLDRCWPISAAIDRVWIWEG